MELVTKKNIQSWIIFALVIINIVVFMFISNFAYLRFDLTEDKTFSISKPTIDLVKGLDGVD